MAEVDFQKIGQNVKKLVFVKAPQQDIDDYLSTQGTDLATLNASGFGPSSRRADDKTSIGKSFVQGMGQGASAGYGDELGAALAATIGRPTSSGLEAIPGQNWTDRYTSARDEIRGKMDVTQQDNPGTYLAGNLTGAIAPALLAPELYGSKFIASAPSMLNMMGRSAAVGGALGGLTSFGNARGTPGQQGLETAAGATVGGALGAVVPPLIKGGTELVTKGANAIRGALGGTQTVAAEAPATMATSQAVAPVQSAIEATQPVATATVTPNARATAIAELSRTLERSGYDTAQAKKAIDALGPMASLADISEATQRLLRTQKSAPGAAVDIVKNSLENRQAGQQGRLIDSVQRAFGTRAGIYETDDAMLSRLAEEAGPLYDDAFQNAKPVDLKGVLSSIDGQLTKMPEKSPVRGALERVRGLLGRTIKDPDGTERLSPYFDLETLHNAKLAIDDMLSNFSGENSMGKVSKRAVVQVKDALMNAMDEASPSYGSARNTFSGIMTGRDAMQQGRAFIREDAEALASTMSGLAKEDQELFRIGALRGITDIIKSKPSDISVVQQLRKTGLLEKVRELLPTDQAYNRFIKELGAERQFANTRAMVMGGSQTAEKLLDAGDQARNLAQTASDVAGGNTTGLMARAAQSLGRLFGPGEGARASIAQMLTEKDPVAIQKILDEIAAFQRSQAIRNSAAGMGTVGGATTAGPAAGSFVSGRNP